MYVTGYMLEVNEWLPLCLITKKAGVSVATVSRVLNDKGYIHGAAEASNKKQ